MNFLPFPTSPTSSSSPFLSLSLFLSFYLSFFLSIYLFSFLSIFFPFCLSFFLSVLLSIYLSIFLSFHPTFFLSFAHSLSFTFRFFCLPFYVSVSILPINVPPHSIFPHTTVGFARCQDWQRQHRPADHKFRTQLPRRGVIDVLLTGCMCGYPVVFHCYALPPPLS